MRVERRGGLVVLNDAYNANPASMGGALETLAALPGRRIALLGDMLELGDIEAEAHAEVVALAGRAGRGGDLLDQAGDERQAVRAVVRGARVGALTVLCHPAHQRDRARSEPVALELPGHDGGVVRGGGDREVDADVPGQPVDGLALPVRAQIVGVDAVRDVAGEVGPVARRRL
ncbi:MAG: hypothetical protein KC656_38085, partial [Myxococcales bacterium]|nr:hypothetical protein [Myxococcales bacterium]